MTSSGMPTWTTVLAAVLALTAVAALAQLVWAYLSIPALADVPPFPPDRACPRVSIIVAARNEERHVESAVRALLNQSYPDVEIVVVDDRSTDRTGPVLQGLASGDPRLAVVRVDALPHGWLGKNHALQQGAERASGELLLFADADVILDRHALARAVRLMAVERADHLAVAPDVVVPTWPLALVVNYFMMWFMLYLRPWRARDPRSRAFIGIGAFNLLRAEAYRAVGGHTRIALRPDDDIMLGKLVKRAGFRQLVATGDSAVSVEWYRTLGELARGFRKNAFAGLHYSVALVVAAVVGNLLLAVWPFAAVWLSHGPDRWLYAVAALAQVVGYAGPAIARRTIPWLAPLYPLAALLFMAILVAAVGRTLRRGGIEWRDTFYPLATLRANRV
jgi:glycosyltransferase involved in cell wall biosynthesis